MSLSARQLAKLRELGRASNELELRHEARRAAITTQREYLVTLDRKLDRLEDLRDAAHRAAATTEEQDAVAQRHKQDEKRLREEILAARGELEQLREQLSQITLVSAPLRELIDRVLHSANLEPQDAGVAFGDDTVVARDPISLGAG